MGGASAPEFTPSPAHVRLMKRIHSHYFTRGSGCWAAMGEGRTRLSTARPLITHGYVAVSTKGPKLSLYLTWKGRREIGV